MKRKMISEAELITWMNDELVAFCLIRKILPSGYLHFSRSALTSPDNLEMAIKFLRHLGHKERPEHPEETLQKTIQNLRDKGYLQSLARGEYKLTEIGVVRMAKEFEILQSYKSALKASYESASLFFEK